LPFVFALCKNTARSSFASYSRQRHFNFVPATDTLCASAPQHRAGQSRSGPAFAARIRAQARR
jgi:hypothetical protein